MKDPAKAGNFWGQRPNEMPSHNAVRGFRPEDFRVFPLDGQEETGWKEKRKEVSREEWEEKNEISIFSKGVFL